MTATTGVRRRLRRRELTILAILGGSVLVLAAAGLCLGAYRLSVAEAMQALAGQGTTRDEFIVVQVRAPRLAAGVLAGAALAVSGGIFQTLLRNPLASPDIIGITAGASVAAVFAITVLAAGGVAVSGWAFAGAAIVAGGVYLLSWRGGFSRLGGVTGYRFVLVGIAAAFMANAVLGFLLTRGEIRQAQTAIAWMVGSLGGARWPEITVLAVLLAALLLVVAALQGALRLLQLGDETARGLGLPVERSRVALLTLAVALAAVATAVTGPIAFVAFVATPIARRLVRTGGPALLPAALVGAVVVTGADLVAQHALPGVKAPVGIVTGIVGGPYLLWLLATAGRTARGA
ncbi:FecCD family ABC transporter permease [Phytohabitans rumicis]|uniref:Iron ABC transporter permease n=1 Tax=Phytohabitans rumicis TaxID=1076125 RepID=A0A6V8LIA6_9ACTN|nr:iron chelate uptake ABC transporter family permease subunit [Phytohabitans rumicis]GFJ93876.1 iron ABC transporter permease [Phytohabitans rumicis]